MRKGFRKAAAFLSALVMSLGTASAVSADVFAAESAADRDAVDAFEEEQVTGGCTWTLDNGVLTVSGNGAMADYDWDDPAPWMSEDVRRIVVEQGVTAIGSHAFYYCCDADEIIVSDSVAEISDYAFAFTDISEIDLPQSVTSIGENAFCYCTKLERITVPGKVSSVGSAAFADCTGLKYAAFLEGVKEIPSRTFYGCESLQNVTIPDGVESIEPSAFYGCTAMKKITVPESVTSIGETAIGYYRSERWDEKLDGMTIYGKKGSAAETYAETNGFAFVSTDNAQIGDVNFDGTISVADVTAIQKHLAELEPFTDAQLDLADTNGDGVTDISDATRLQEYIAE